MVRLSVNLNALLPTLNFLLALFGSLKVAKITPPLSEINCDDSLAVFENDELQGVINSLISSPSKNAKNLALGLSPVAVTWITRDLIKGVKLVSLTDSPKSTSFENGLPTCNCVPLRVSLLDDVTLA